MGTTRSYKAHLNERLKDPKEATEYLNAALEDDDPNVFLLALKDIADAQGMDSLSENPYWYDFLSILKIAGLKAQIECS